MSQESPEWLNHSFFDKVIKHHISSDAKVTEFTIQSGAKPGENFASDLFRASINYASESEAKSISVIVKVMPMKEEGDIDGKQLFLTEMKMYDDTLIDINRLLLNAHVALKLFPR